uniref:Uncharacterized protein n=1 Tax=Steinernema glaseri TaxID=37863 RepID=A0A1I7XZ98_9BILA
MTMFFILGSRIILTLKAGIRTRDLLRAGQCRTRHLELAGGLIMIYVARGLLREAPKASLSPPSPSPPPRIDPLPLSAAVQARPVNSPLARPWNSSACGGEEAGGGDDDDGDRSMNSSGRLGARPALLWVLFALAD